VLVEDCLLENMTAANSDALEIQGAQAAWGCIVRRCEARHSTGGNSDSYDFNGSSGVLIEDCIAHDFTDKGISLGASGAGGSPDFGITVRNCLIYNVDTGIAIKDGSTVNFYQNTIASAAFGMRLYQKYNTPADGGHVTNGYNNIIWGNATSIDLTNNSSLVANYSDIEGTNYPGTGNLSTDPLFADAAQHDYRLASNSPCLTTGRDGTNMGVSFPVGAYIRMPANLAATAVSNSVRITWPSSGTGVAVYEIERSRNGDPFSYVQSVTMNTLTYLDEGLLPGNYQYRVRGVSLASSSAYVISTKVVVGTPPVITLLV
jgi:hypothetical protein